MVKLLEIGVCLTGWLVAIPTIFLQPIPILVKIIVALGSISLSLSVYFKYKNRKTMFKVGDKVRCIKESKYGLGFNCVVGEIFIVRKINYSEEFGTLLVFCIQPYTAGDTIYISVLASRFELVVEQQKEFDF